MASLVATYGFAVADHEDARDLGDMYFRDEADRLVGRMNGTHCIGLAVRR